jgi:hypothetical protein
MSYQYILYVDEAGDDKAESLRPNNPDGNSEWLCLGGYLVRAKLEPQLDEVRDTLLEEIGGKAGGVLHYRNYKRRNRIKVCRKLATFPARAFVVCSFKGTMVGYENKRAARAGTDPRQILYNFVTRILLERVTEFVKRDAQLNEYKEPVLKIIMASRKGHHFGQFKDYVQKLLDQAKAGVTYLDVRVIAHDVLRYDQILRAPASKVAGLQLADTVVSSTFQSIERSSPYFGDAPALELMPIIAHRKPHPKISAKASNLGMTLFPTKKAVNFLTDEQWGFFEKFGYDREYLLSNKFK